MSKIVITGSIYSPLESAIIYAQILDDAGEPANSATVTLTVFYSDGTKYIDGVTMTYIPGSNGLYKYEFTAPSDAQRLIADVESADPTAYGTEDIYVPEFTVDINTIDSNTTRIFRSRGQYNQSLV